MRRIFSIKRPHQRQQIVRWFTNHLKLLAGRVSIAKLESIQRNARTEQTGPEMKHMGFPEAVGKPDGIEFEMLKIGQATRLGNLDIEASAANLAVAFLNRTVVDNVVARCKLVAAGTADLS